VRYVYHTAVIGYALVLGGASGRLEKVLQQLISQPCDKGVILNAPAAAPCPSNAAPWILASTILGSSLAFIDGSVVNLALPALQASLNATVVDVQWVVEAYALLLAALILVGGSLGDTYGRKRIYIAGIVLFSAASTWCGLASNVSQLIFGRAIQGVGAALLIPGSLAIISASFEKSKRGRAIGVWSGFTSITAAAGPVLGGFLIEHATWRWVFFINLPLAVVVLVLTLWRVPESRNVRSGARLDLLGASLATIGLGGIIYALIESSKNGWTSPSVIITLVAGCAALVAFIAVETHSRSPLLPLGLFRSMDFSAVNLVTLFLYSALSILFFLFPLDLIQVQGYSATAAGASMLPFIFLMFLLSRWSGGLADRYGAKPPLVFGPIVVAIGFCLFALPSAGGSYWTTFFPAMIVLGLGMATSVTPLTTTVMNSVPEEHAGIASGINNAFSRLAGVLSIAVFGIVMLASFEHHLSARLAAIDIEPGIHREIEGQRVKLAAIEIPQQLDAGERQKVRRSIDESFIGGFRLVMFAASGLALLSSVTAWLMIERKHTVSASLE
jgi:EmrB/QacA subfamily drug resistance transporter